MAAPLPRTIMTKQPESYSCIINDITKCFSMLSECSNPGWNDYRNVFVLILPDLMKIHSRSMKPTIAAISSMPNFKPYSSIWNIKIQFIIKRVFHYAVTASGICIECYAIKCLRRYVSNHKKCVAMCFLMF